MIDPRWLIQGLYILQKMVVFSVFVTNALFRRYKSTLLSLYKCTICKYYKSNYHLSLNFGHKPIFHKNYDLYITHYSRNGERFFFASRVQCCMHNDQKFRTQNRELVASEYLYGHGNSYFLCQPGYGSGHRFDPYVGSCHCNTIYHGT